MKAREHRSLFLLPWSTCTCEEQTSEKERKRNFPGMELGHFLMDLPIFGPMETGDIVTPLEVAHLCVACQWGKAGIHSLHGVTHQLEEQMTPLPPSHLSTPPQTLLSPPFLSHRPVTVTSQVGKDSHPQVLSGSSSAYGQCLSFKAEKASRWPHTCPSGGFSKEGGPLSLD